MVLKRSLAPQVVWRRSLRRPLAALTIDDVPLLNSPSTLEAERLNEYPMVKHGVLENNGKKYILTIYSRFSQL